MDTFYELFNGILIIDKKILATDLLKKESNFKYLINKNRPIYRPPNIIKNNNNVEINFEKGTDIDLSSNYIEEFRILKNKYKLGLKGKINIRVTTNSIYTTTIDLNGKDDIIVY